MNEYYIGPYLCHYGTPKHSGRYPYGSGEDPYQHHRVKTQIVNTRKAIGSTRSERSEYKKKSDSLYKDLSSMNQEDRQKVAKKMSDDTRRMAYYGGRRYAHRAGLKAGIPTALLINGLAGYAVDVLVTESATKKVANVLSDIGTLPIEDYVVKNKKIGR